MPGSSVPKTLILYSCPIDQDRLRLDKEHQAISHLLQKHQLGEEIVRRLHATTVLDFAQALRAGDYDIVQFSGHGCREGFCLEDNNLARSTLVGPAQTAQIIRSALPSLRLAMFVSCFSASSVISLINVAPFLITLEGKADDEAAIDFICTFYDEFYRHNGIEQAFNAATCFLDFSGNADKVRPVLSRRAKERKGPLIQACFGGRKDSIFIDISEAESDIAALGIPRDDFLSLLTRKVRLHRWIFRYSREKALLSIGSYFGLFSWTDSDDVVTCHRIMQLKGNADNLAYEAWTALIIGYNDLCCEKYRILPDPASPENSGLLGLALERMKAIFDQFLTSPAGADALRKTCPIQFAVSRANAYGNLQMATASFNEKDFQSTVIKLETALSALHDLVNALAPVLTEPPLKPDATKFVLRDKQAVSGSTIQ